jgi:predicted O-methyltransferase YrrM
MPTRDLPEGWLSSHDIAELSRLARGMTVLELGAYHGRSTTVLSRVAKYVISVDRHEGVPRHDEDSLPDYLAAIRPLRNVAMVVAHFEDFVPLLKPVDLVFIDGQHEYEFVMRDIILTLLVDPAVVAFHDYDFSEVKQAATEMFGDPNRVHGSVASFRRHP